MGIAPTSARTPCRHRAQAAFTLIESMLAMALVGTVTSALLTSFTSGAFTLQMARENLRATQVMLERMETVRLYSWDQVNRSGFIPSTFTAYYDPNSTNHGVVYQGAFTWAPVSLAVPYANQMTQLTVQVTWETGGLVRTRSYTTYIARNGLQNYIF
jgi:prepilin-type N-terminal cleavage/methylation domain-containing protein